MRRSCPAAAGVPAAGSEFVPLHECSTQSRSGARPRCGCTRNRTGQVLRRKILRSHAAADGGPSPLHPESCFQLADPRRRVWQKLPAILLVLALKPTCHHGERHVTAADQVATGCRFGPGMRGCGAHPTSWAWPAACGTYEVVGFIESGEDGELADHATAGEQNARGAFRSESRVALPTPCDRVHHRRLPGLASCCRQDCRKPTTSCGT